MVMREVGISKVGGGNNSREGRELGMREVETREMGMRVGRVRRWGVGDKGGGNEGKEVGSWGQGRWE